MNNSDKIAIEKVLSTKDAAKYLSLSGRTLEAFRRTGNGPSYIKVSNRCVRYRLSDLTAWLNNRARISTSEVQF